MPNPDRRTKPIDPKVMRAWEEFLDPDVVRPRLIAASLYVAAYEALKDAVIERIRDFYCNGFDEKGDLIDPEYQSKVLSRNRSPLYASLDWLKSSGAIDDDDLTQFDRIKVVRNVLAHRLFSALGSDGLPPELGERFQDMASLLSKIEAWWIKNVEVPTNPDFDGQDVADGDIVSGRVLGLHVLSEIALGDEEKARAYLAEFRKLAEGERDA
jgi:hypothetical protein